MRKKTVYSMCCLCVFFWISAVQAAGVPVPARIGGTVTVDGVQLTQSTDNGYIFEVIKTSGSAIKDLNGNKAQDDDGLSDGDLWYVIDIPIFDADTQAEGVNPGDTVRIQVLKNGSLLVVTSPASGEFTVGGSGSSEQMNLVASSSVQSDGDVAPLGSRDGVVNVADALVCLRFALGLETPTAEDVLHGDVAPLDASNQPDPDGSLTVADALVILRKALGLVSF